MSNNIEFRKKPVVIEAMQWDGTESGIQRIKARFPALDTVGKTGHLKRDEVTHWRIATLEGSLNVSKGDWIIRGVKGELYPCKPDIFEATYERAALAAKPDAPASDWPDVSPAGLRKMAEIAAPNNGAVFRAAADEIERLSAVGAPEGWKLVPVEPTDEMETAAENDYEQRGETFPDWKSKWRAMLAAAPSPDGKAEQAEAPSDLSVLRRIHKLLVNQVRPALRSPVITKDVDDAAEALSALMSRTQTEAPSDSTLKLAEMILADCGHSTAISTRLRDRVAERIERHIATQPTASLEQAEAPMNETLKTMIADMNGEIEG